METIIKVLGYGLLFALIAAGLSVLFAFPVYLLWNALMPELFHLPAISFWQALGLTVLCSLLFKSSNGSASRK